MIEKTYYSINPYQESIEILEKPNEGAIETMIRLNNLVRSVVTRQKPSILSLATSNYEIPGYCKFFIGKKIGETVPVIKTRRPYNLSKNTEIKLIVKTIMQQYSRTYEEKRCNTGKKWDNFLNKYVLKVIGYSDFSRKCIRCLGGNADIFHLENLKKDIDSNLKQAGQQALDWLKLILILKERLMKKAQKKKTT